MLSDLAFGLAERGMRVTVITSRLCYDGDDKSLARHESFSGVDIRRVWTTRFGRSSLTLRAIDYLTFYISAAWALLRTAGRGDVVIAMTDPPMLSVIAAPIAKLRGAVLVNWLQDLFPEVAEALYSGGKLSRPLFRTLRKLRNSSLRRADMNVAIGELMAERIQRAGVSPSRICVRPNWADCDAVHPVTRSDNPLRDDWNLANHFVVGYSGNLGRAHEFQPILEAIETIERDGGRSLIPSIRWLFIGGGHAAELLKAEADKRGLTTVSFRPYQTRSKLSQSLSAADVHIVTLRPELEGLIVPSKFYGIAAAGRPVLFIGAAGGELARLTQQHACGISVANGDGNALREAILNLAHDLESVSRMGKNARQACQEFYDKSIAIGNWETLLRSLSEHARVHSPIRSRSYFSAGEEGRPIVANLPRNARDDHHQRESKVFASRQKADLPTP